MRSFYFYSWQILRAWGNICPLSHTPGSDGPVLPVSGGGGAREKQTTASHICCFSRTKLFAVLSLWNQRYIIIYSFHCTSCRLKIKYKTPNISLQSLILLKFEKRRDSLGTSLWNCDNNKKCWCFVFGF